MNIIMVKETGELGRIWKAKNRAEARQRVLELMATGEAAHVRYGRKVYTPSEVYRTW